jgi:hypothetical protein
MSLLIGPAIGSDIYGPVITYEKDTGKAIFGKGKTLDAIIKELGTDVHTDYAGKTALVSSAASDLGFATEVTQENIASLALNKQTYPQYLELKRGTLNRIRTVVMRTYMDTYEAYKDLGMGNKEAEKMAKSAAVAQKKAQMGIYETLFPHSGKEAKRVY